MVFDKLADYLNRYEPIMKRGSGLSIKDLRFLENIGVVNLVKVPLKSGKSPKSSNAFELTIFGRDIIRQYVNNEISSEEILSNIHHDMSVVKSQVKDVKLLLSTLEDKLTAMEEFLKRYKIKRENGRNMVELSEQELIDLLRLAEERADRSDRMGLLFSTEIYFDVISENTPYTDSSIAKKLYMLYEKNILDLQMGPDHGRRSVKSPSGKKFSWGNLVI